MRQRRRTFLALLAGGVSVLAGCDSEPPDDAVIKNIDETRAALHRRVNEVRENDGAPALTLDGELSAVAQTHSADMAEKGYYAHTSPEGRTFEPPCEKSSENIYRYVGGADGVEYAVNEIVDAFLDSPFHKINMLDPQWRLTGIGIAVTEDYMLYATQNFC